jgi:hypothetical protein
MSFLFFEPTAPKMSSTRYISCNPQEPRQRWACKLEAESLLRVKCKIWQPRENTRSTAVDVAKQRFSNHHRNLLQGALTGNAQIITRHPGKGRKGMALLVPPAECVLHILHRLGKVFINLTTVGNLLAQRYVREVSLPVLGLVVILCRYLQHWHNTNDRVHHAPPTRDLCQTILPCPHIP